VPTFTVGPRETRLTLAAFLKRSLPPLSWSGARRLVERGRVEIDGITALDSAARVEAGQEISVREAGAAAGASPTLIVYEDRHLVVADKPAGMSSVPYERGERTTLIDAVRDEWRRRGVEKASRALYVVHRLDRATSGLLVFARTRAAERGLQKQFRRREVERLYVCIAHGAVRDQTIRSRLRRDRGDGLRGSSRPSDARDEGKLAVTHVRAVEPLSGATVCEVRLETGRTHQIRIHLAERGHPLVGETVYIRDLVARGGRPIEAPRLFLHAATLAFTHPLAGRRVSFESPLPAEFSDLKDRLRSK
jgi:23S rRNA pseudouridine1911/1915/1917 synthase